MSDKDDSATGEEKPELSKKELKAQKKAQKKAEKEAKKKDPVKVTMRNLYRLIMLMAFALVIWLGYEAFLIIAANMDLGL